MIKRLKFSLFFKIFLIVLSLGPILFYEKFIPIKMVRSKPMALVTPRFLYWHGVGGDKLWINGKAYSMQEAIKAWGVVEVEDAQMHLSNGLVWPIFNTLDRKKNQVLKGDQRIKFIPDNTDLLNASAVFKSE